MNSQINKTLFEKKKKWIDEEETNQHIFEFDQAFDQGLETHSVSVFHEDMNQQTTSLT